MSRAQLEKLTEDLAERLNMPLQLDYYQPGDNRYPYGIVQVGAGTLADWRKLKRQTYYERYGSWHSQPFGSSRMSAGECESALRMALTALYLTTPERKKRRAEERRTQPEFQRRQRERT